jgi:hypothetical protein
LGWRHPWLRPGSEGHSVIRVASFPSPLLTAGLLNLEASAPPCSSASTTPYSANLLTRIIHEFKEVIGSSLPCTSRGVASEATVLARSQALLSLRLLAD